MPIGVRYGPSWLSFSGLDLIPCWHAPLGILEDGTYYNTLGPFALSLISNRYLPVLNLPSDTFGKWAEVGLPLSDRDRWL